MHPYPGATPPLVTIGDIICTQDEVITPSGRAPIANTTWTFTDMSHTTHEIPAWAIVSAIILFFCCLLGLLMLLVKKERTYGWVQVTVHGQGLMHVTQIPVFSAASVMDFGARVNYARTLAAFRG